MVEVNIYSILEFNKEDISSANLLEHNWYSPGIPSRVNKIKFYKRTNKAIIKEGKRLAKKDKILKDISAVVTSTNFSRIGIIPNNYVTVDFYTFLTPILRHLNP
jgi:hypothetical protein